MNSCRLGRPERLAVAANLSNVRHAHRLLQKPAVRSAATAGQPCFGLLTAGFYVVSGEYRHWLGITKTVPRVGYQPYEPQLTISAQADDVWTIEGPEVQYRVACSIIPPYVGREGREGRLGPLVRSTPLSNGSHISTRVPQFGRTSKLNMAPSDLARSCMMLMPRPFDSCVATKPRPLSLIAMATP